MRCVFVSFRILDMDSDNILWSIAFCRSGIVVACALVPLLACIFWFAKGAVGIEKNNCLSDCLLRVRRLGRTEIQSC